MRLLVALVATATLFATTTAKAESGRLPVETSPPNASGQYPAFPSQTRAPAAPTTPVQLKTVVDGLDDAWALEFFPDGRMLVTEKAGVMKLFSAGGATSKKVNGVPPVDSRGQGGLLDVAIPPNYAEEGMIYFSFAEPRDDGNGTTLARAKLVEEHGVAHLQDVQILFRQIPSWQSTKHFGSRIVFAIDGKVFLTTGERSLPEPRVLAQDLDNHLGKVVRIARDGSVPADNPFVADGGAKPEIWSYGHRNLQSAALDGKGRLWTVEHGPRGGDELNHPEAGKNYGWPIITYGEDYSGAPIGAGITKKDGMEQPVYYWDPVIAPSGMDFYAADLMPGWRGSFLIGGLVSRSITRVSVKDDKVVDEERIDLGERVRDVKVGPDGAVYALTDGSDGKILRLRPRN